MADTLTKEKAIIKDLIAALSDISQDEGYRTDIGDNIKDWNTLPVPSFEEDETIVMDVSANHDEQNEFAAYHKQTLRIEIVSIFINNENPVDVLRDVSADIYECIGNNKSSFYSKYKDVVFTPISREKEIKEDAQNLISAIKIVIDVTYSTEPWLINEAEYNNDEK